jgi:pSer/pThr/pTyr-binding forkhead associated (FHA) protein
MPGASPWPQPQAPQQATSLPGFGTPTGPAQGFPQDMSVSSFPDADKTMLRTTGPQGRTAIIRIEEGKESGKVYEINKDSFSIGRSRESDIFLEDLAVSRLHASIINMGNGNYALKDEGSANGTKLNGQMINKYQPYPLQEGDKIQLGQTVLVFARR